MGENDTGGSKPVWGFISHVLNCWSVYSHWNGDGLAFCSAFTLELKLHSTHSVEHTVGVQVVLIFYFVSHSVYLALAYVYFQQIFELYQRGYQPSIYLCLLFIIMPLRSQNLSIITNYNINKRKGNNLVIFFCPIWFFLDLFYFLWTRRKEKWNREEQ